MTSRWVILCLSLQIADSQVSSFQNRKNKTDFTQIFCVIIKSVECDLRWNCVTHVIVS